MDYNERTLLAQDYRQRKPTLDKVTDEKIVLWDSNGTGRQEYTHTQNVTSTEWIVQHNLNCQYPNVLAFDNDNNEIIGSIDYYSVNLLKINFDVNIAGKAIISN